MHRVVAKRIFLKIKLTHDNCHCLRMYSNFIPWKNSLTGYYSTDFRIYKQLVAEKLGVDREHAAMLLRSNRRVIGIPEERITKNCHICQVEEVDFNTSIRDIKFLELSEEDLINRILLLKEMGAQYINTAMLRTCASRVHVVSFKAYTKIPNDDIIAKNMYSHLHEPPPGVPPLSDLNDYMTVKEYRKRCLLHWLKWRLEIPDDNEKLLETFFKRLRYKSFARLRKSFDILHEELGMPVSLIREKKCLSYVSGVDLQKILTHLPDICGVSVKELLKNNLPLLRMTYKSLCLAKFALEDFGVTSEQLLETPKVLLVNSDSLEVGLETISTTPELKILIDHPRLLRILLTKDGVQRRLDYLRYLSINHVTVAALGRTKVEFDKYLKSGTYKAKGDEIGLMLKKYFKKSVAEIQEKIEMHPLWKYVDLFTIHTTLHYLMESFDAEDIFKNLPLILHSRDKVEFRLVSLIEMNKQINENNRFTPSQILALCAYEIEKEFHFTGDGVWEKNKILTKSPEALPNETEEWKVSKKNIC
uniref:Uncharacterized protein n=1 Tax=Fopius arisanus TaxID=64838 RepID=A0A0C9RB16_9HYME